MGQLKYYNESTGEWEVTVVGAQGPKGEQGDPGYIGLDGPAGILSSPFAPQNTDIIWVDTSEDAISVPLGGNAGQVLTKVDSSDFNLEWSSVYSESETDALLANKSDISHIHDDRYYTESEIDTKLSSKSETSHTHDDRYYTETETDSAISNAIAALINTAPSTLDTLSELSNSLADDPNFATTMTTALASKSDTSHTHDDRYYTESEVSSLLAELLPAGTINQTARETAPTGWLLCHGQSVSRTEYSTLFNAIGTVYGSGDGSTTFSIPNMQGRIPVGKDSATFSTLGSTGGAESVTLQTTQIPSHTHTGTTGGHSADHNHGFSGTTAGVGDHQHIVYAYKDKDDLNFTGNSNRLQGSDAVTPYDQLTSGAGAHSHTFSGTTGGTSGNHTHDFTSNATGGGGSHTNLQPYIVVNYMIKI